MKENTLILKELKEAQRFADLIASSLPEKIQIDDWTSKSTLPFMAISLREVLLHRVSPLTTAAVDLFERNQVIPAVVLTRAVFETVAILPNLHKRLERFLDDKNTSELHKFLKRCLFGSRNNQNFPKPFSVGKFVNQVDKTIPGFSSTYSSLCEYTHPNWAGTKGAFGQIDWEQLEHKLGPVDRSPAKKTGVCALVAALMIFHQCYNESGDLVIQLNDYFEQGGSP